MTWSRLRLVRVPWNEASTPCYGHARIRFNSLNSTFHSSILELQSHGPRNAYSTVRVSPFHNSLPFLMRFARALRSSPYIDDLEKC